MNISHMFESFRRELNSLDQNRSRLVDYGLGPERVTFQTFPGASSNEILALERGLGLVLPRSFKRFLEHWNGANLYVRRHAPGIKVFGTNDLLKRNQIWIEHELYPEEMIPDFIVFADWGGQLYSVFDAHRLNAREECPVLDGNPEFSPQQWEVICSSFEEWLDKVIEAEGKYFWMQ